MHRPSWRVMAVSLGVAAVLAGAVGVIALTSGVGSGGASVRQAAANPNPSPPSPQAALPLSPVDATPPVSTPAPTTAAPTSASVAPTRAPSAPSTPTPIASPTYVPPAAPPPSTHAAATPNPTHPTGVKITVTNRSSYRYTVQIDGVGIELAIGQTGVMYVPAPNNPPDHRTGNGSIQVFSKPNCGVGSSLDVQATDTYTVTVNTYACGKPTPPGYGYHQDTNYTVRDDMTGVEQVG